jgi:N4-gp56 family major capsid protein
MSIIGSTGFNGVIQKFLDSKWFDLPMRTFESPLANSKYAALGTIPNRQGQSIEFRRFAHFSPAALFDQNSEPAAEQGFQADVLEVPLMEFVDKMSLGNLLMKTDRIDLMAKGFELFVVGLKRGVHRECNRTLVNGFTNTGLFNGVGNFTGAGLRTLFAGSVNAFADLTQDSFLRMRDFENARSRLENSGVPPAMANGDYIAVISHAVQTQLIADDDEFRKAVRYDSQQNNDILKGAKLTSYNRMTFMLQHDDYRSQLASAGGALATRDDNGLVTVCHVFGKEAYAYVDLAGDKAARQNAKPIWKIQDITPTGHNTTVGYRVPFRAAVIQPDFGLNLAGTTKFSKTVQDT